MYYKILFLSSLVFGTLLSISAYSWMGMWIGLEVNLLSMIPLMSSTKNMMASEAALKYFVTQALASTLLLFSVIMMSMKFPYDINFTAYFSLIFSTSLLTKMGAAPLHYWFPEVIEGMNWSNALILLTWQKIAPMMLISYTDQNTALIVTVIASSMLVSGILGINQTSLRKIMAYSSINHIGWMLSSMLLVETIWSYYFAIYTIITMNIVLIFKTLNIFHVNQMFISMNQEFLVKLFFIMNFLSLGGLPPFLGFMPKWITIQALVQSNLYPISLMMILMTLATLYFYMRVTFSTLLVSNLHISYYKHTSLKKFTITVCNLVALMGLACSTFMFNFV